MTQTSETVETIVAPIIALYGGDPGNLLQILRDAQDALDWLSPETQGLVAEQLDIPVTRVAAVVQFYSHLYDTPRGKYRVLFSHNITDRMAGSPALMAHMLKRLKLKRGVVSADGLVSVGKTSCTGMCDQGPALLVNNRAITRLTLRRIDEICDLIRVGAPLSHWPAHYFRVEDNIERADMLLGSAYAPGEALRAAIACGPTGMMAEMKKSNLRGRGGAGFTTAVKWEACRDAKGDGSCNERYIVCNADEGEPGTFKDRVLLQSFSERVFEGMAIAGYVTGARKGLVYLRGEYSYLRGPLEAKLSEMRRNRLLGMSICGVPGFDFDIVLHMGAGAYICGEETALIESLEGKPGHPRIRPPFPVTRGYKNQPTVVNNVETLCKVTEVALHGGLAYAGTGTRQSAGTKIISVSGDVERPGLYEYPFGVRVSQVLDDAGAYDAIAVQISGAAGQCLTPQEFGRRIAFEDVPTSGSFMVFGNTRDLFEAALNYAHFFEHESCGFCTPCRVGTALVARIMEKIHSGHGARYEFNELNRLHQLISTSSHCGLGATATSALQDIMTKFPTVFDRRLIKRDFEPGFDLDAALARAREVSNRDDANAHLAEGIEA
jgi:[NiFe] hydrogenase diaphorase moiety large subunit